MLTIITAAGSPAEERKKERKKETDRRCQDGDLMVLRDSELSISSHKQRVISDPALSLIGPHAGERLIISQGGTTCQQRVQEPVTRLFSHRG